MLKQFLKLDSASGVVLTLSAMLAMLWANSPLAPVYNMLIELDFGITIGQFLLVKPLLLWINDGLMTLFFLTIGLELKREILVGHLANHRQIILPAIGALGGMLMPALIYIAINSNNVNYLHGWAIPAATDIAFALAILSLLGNKIPPSLRVFLVSLAIFDDIGAIIIIAVFYNSHVSITALWVIGFCIMGLALLNWRNVSHFTPYIIISLLIWLAFIKSGIHPTLTGVILAFFIPLHVQNMRKTWVKSPLRQMEHDLHFSVYFIVLPVFSFVNSGINVWGVSTNYILHPVPISIALGLFLGKQWGVFSFCWLSIRLGLCERPLHASWRQLYGVAILCGIGFTMSLFIGSLAFGTNIFFDQRLGIAVGSITSAIVGYWVLRYQTHQ